MTTQLAPRLPTSLHGLPPPPRLDVESDLVDAGRAVGWIDGDAVGFRGFADATEAAHAAWVAWRTLARRLARTDGTRPVPIDRAALALERQGGREVILADGRPVATLVRPGAQRQNGRDTFGFEIRVPAPVDRIRVRSMAYLMYRTLRKSGVRWALWRPAPPSPGPRPAQPASTRTRDRGPTLRTRATAARRAARARFSASERPIPAAFQPRRVAGTRVEDASSPLGAVARIVFAAIAAVTAAALALSAPATVTIPIAVVLVAGLGGAAVVLTIDRRSPQRGRRGLGARTPSPRAPEVATNEWERRSSAGTVAEARGARGRTGARSENDRIPAAPGVAAEPHAAGAAMAAERRSAADRELDRVDEASDDSFPASDPPAWAAMRIGPPELRHEPR